jgi:transcription elongation factor GreA
MLGRKACQSPLGTFVVGFRRHTLVSVAVSSRRDAVDGVGQDQTQPESLAQLGPERESVRGLLVLRDRANQRSTHCASFQVVVPASRLTLDIAIGPEPDLRNGATARWRLAGSRATIGSIITSERKEPVVSVDANATVLISAEGYEHLCHELELLRTDARRDLAGRMRDARQDGDLADNPALHDLFEEQQQLERRIAALETQLAVAEIATPAADGRAGLGSVVRVRDADGATSRYELVGPLESDAGNGRVSIAAPVGQALLHQRAGARVEVQTPRGRHALEVVSIRPPAARREAA